MALVSVIMYRWLVVWHAIMYSYVASGVVDVRLLSPRYTGSQFECFDYPSMHLRSYDTDWLVQKKIAKIMEITSPKYWPSTTPGFNEISRRIDLLWNRDDIVKEHAKLVHDINSLKQVMYIAPVAEEKDYEDSIFPDIIETFSTTTMRPTTTRSVKITKPTKSAFPILVLGGGSRRHSTKSQPTKVSKKTINLVGTTSPIVRHPYPFVMAESAHQPVRICMSSPVTYATTTQRPSLWERLVKAIIPR